MGNFLSYAAAVLVSIAVHVLVVGALLVNWQPTTERIVMQPQFIEAQLVELAPKKKRQIDRPVKPKIDPARKKREADQRRAVQKQKAAALKRQQEQALKAEALEKKQAAEAERKRIATEFAKTLAEEEAQINAQEDDRIANSYRQVIQQRLSENWSRPPSARRDMETVIRMQLVPTGRVVGVTVLLSSGDIAFDRSVEQAAFKAEQFFELQQMAPEMFERRFREVDVAFSPRDLRL
jgi:colicin import membrane protein